VEEKIDKEAPAKKTTLSRRKSKIRSAPSKVPTESRPVTDFLSHTKGLLTEQFASILETIVDKSLEGSLPHTKYLFEIGGVKEELQRQVQNNGEPTLAELLLAEVKRHRDAATSSQTCSDPAQPSSECGAKAQ
jgi:hypothetical protein